MADVLYSVRCTTHDVESRRRASLAEAIVESVAEFSKAHGDGFVPTPIQYYAAALSALQASASDALREADVCFLLSKIVPHVPRAALLRSVDATIGMLLKASSRVEGSGQRNAVIAVGYLFAALAKDDWSRPAVLRAFQTLCLQLGTDGPKLRKAVQTACAQAVGGAQNEHAKAPLTLLGDYIATQLNHPKTVRATSRLLAFLASDDLAARLPKSQRKALAESTLGLAASTQDADIAERALAVFALAWRGLGPDAAVSQQLAGLTAGRLAWVSAVQAVGDDQHGASTMRALVARLRDAPFQEAAAALAGVLAARVSIAPSDLAFLAPLMDNQSAWPMTLPLVEAAVRSLAPANAAACGPLLMRAAGALQGLVDEASGEPLADDSPEWKPACEHLVAACARVLGPSAFFDRLPLTRVGRTGLDPARAWLLPVLAHAFDARGSASLAEFKAHVIGMARSCEHAAEEADVIKAAATAKMHRSRAVQLWGLFPTFCAGATDVYGELRGLVKTLAGAMGDVKRPELLMHVCKGLETLVVVNSRVAGRVVKSAPRARADSAAEDHVYGSDDDDDDDVANLDNDNDDGAVSRAAKSKATHAAAVDDDDAALAEAALEALRDACPQLMPVVFNAFDLALRAKLDERAARLVECARALACVCAPEFHSSMLRQVLKKLVDADDDATRVTLIQIAGALALYCADEDADRLFAVISAGTEQTADHAVQKHLYGCLGQLLRGSPAWVLAHRPKLVGLLLGQSRVLLGARPRRLDCVAVLVAQTGAEQGEVTEDLVNEVVLGLKESNRRARKAAFDVLGEVAAVMNARGRLFELLRMVAAGLQAETATLRSASVVALARLTGSFAPSLDWDGEAAELVRAALALAQELSREVVQSVLSLAKVVAIRTPVPALRALLPGIVEALLPWSLDTRNRFAVRIRVVFEKLVKRLSMDEVAALVPEDHRLLAYVRKQLQKRRNRPADAAAERGNDDDDDSVAGHGDAERRVAVGADISNARAGQPTAKRRRHASSAAADGGGGDDDDDDMRDDFARDEAGRIVVPDDRPAPSAGDDDVDEGDDDDDDDLAQLVARAQAAARDSTQRVGKRGGVGAGKAPLQKPKAKKKEQAFGTESRARRAGGDAKYKGAKTDPYAYIPLDARMLNKRNKQRAIQQFQGVGGGKHRGYKSRAHKE